MRTLVINPDAAGAIVKRREQLGLPPIPIEDLQYGDEEVGQIVNLLRAKMLPGKRATLHGLLDILAEGWDIIWLVTHGEEGGWYLSDGLVNVSEMTTMIRSSGTYLTVMNTCSSYEVARAAAKELETAFICTLQEVPDRTAYITGVIFAQKLAAGYDYAEAYELAKPGQTHPYVLIEGKADMPPLERSQYPRGQPPDAETLARVIRGMDDLDSIINGNPRLGLPALKDVVKDLQADLRLIKDQLAQIQEKQKFRNFALWSMGVTIVILIATVAVMAAQILGGAS